MLLFYERMMPPGLRVVAGFVLSLGWGVKLPLVISTEGRDLLAILKLKISHFVRNDILLKVLAGRYTSD